MTSSGRLCIALIASVALSAVVSAVECDSSAVFDVANAHYPSCEGLYYVLAQSMPANYTSELCGEPDCAHALAQLRALDLGDCVVFGSTTLTSDILDQCPASSSSGDVSEASRGLGASAGTSTGTAIVLSVLGLVALVILVTATVRRQALAKRALQQLEAVDGKLARAGDSDAPYSAAIDLQMSTADSGLRGVGATTS